MRKVELTDYEIKFLTALLEAQIYEIGGAVLNNDNPYNSIMFDPIKKVIEDIIEKLNTDNDLNTNDNIGDMGGDNNDN